MSLSPEYVPTTPDHQDTGDHTAIIEEDIAHVAATPSHEAIGEEAVVSVEVNYKVPALIGLLRISALRHSSLVEKGANALATSREVHREAAAAITDRRAPEPKLQPDTLLQRQQALRAARRQHRANSRRLQNLAWGAGYGFGKKDGVWLREKGRKKTYIDDVELVVDLRNKDAFINEHRDRLVHEKVKERINEENLGRRHRKRLNKVAGKFINNKSVARKVEHKIIRSGDGEDIPGKIIGNVHNRVQSFAEGPSEIDILMREKMKELKNEKRERKKKSVQERKVEKQENRVTRRHKRVAEGKSLKQRGQKAVLQTRKAYDTRVTGGSIKNSYEARKQEETTEEKIGRQRLFKKTERTATRQSHREKIELLQAEAKTLLDELSHLISQKGIPDREKHELAVNDIREQLERLADRKSLRQLVVNDIKEQLKADGKSLRQRGRKVVGRVAKLPVRAKIAERREERNKRKTEDLKSSLFKDI